MPVTDPELRADPGVWVAGACLSPWAAAWTGVDERLLLPLRTQVETSLARHREISAEVGLTAPLADDPEALKHSLVTYRHDVDSQVLAPLLKLLEMGGPTVIVSRVFAEALDASTAACGDLPAGERLPWEEGALDVKPSDRALRRAGKVLARAVSAARKAGLERVAPLRTLAVRHLHRTVLPAQDSAAAKAIFAWADWMGQLEAAWIGWGDAALPVLMRAEVPMQEEERSQAWSSLQVAATGLEERLAALASEDPGREAAREADAALGVARGALEADLAVLGSFLLRPRLPSEGAEEFRLISRAERVAGPWDDQVVARLRLRTALLAILAGASAVQHRLMYRLGASCLDPTAALTGMADRLDAMARELDAQGRSSRVTDGFWELRARAEAIVAEAIAVMPDPVDVAQSARENSDAAVDALQAMVRQAPATLVLHEVGHRPPTGRRAAEARPLAFQELAGQAFDALRIERTRASAFGVVKAMESLGEGVAELPDVIGFAFDQAAKELQEQGSGASDQVVGLVKEALKRTAGVLRAVPGTVEGAIADAGANIAREVGDGCEGLFDRVGAGRMQAQILAAQSRFSDLRAWLNETLGPPLNRGLRRIGRRLAIARAVVSRALKRGTAIVEGEVGETHAGSDRTIRNLASAEALVEATPLVYRRLFTLDPLKEPALLAGRASELADGMARWRRWKVEDAIPLIFRAHPGVGVTSFLNALCWQIRDEGGTIEVVRLAGSIRSEAKVASELASVLGIGSADTLDEIARKVLRAPSDSVPNVVLIDDLEHLYQRVPGGTDLIERVLTLMSETEPQVFWIGGIRSSSWQLIARAEASAVSQVDSIELGPLSAEALREAVIERHRRSGLRVRFEEPVEGRALLRRRLRRLRGTEAHQEVLEADFFDQLHRMLRGNLRMALFQWLLAADFETAEGEVYVHAHVRPDFSALEALDLAQNFTLKAFLDHRTLSLADHDAIFRIPRQESYQLFESLGNRHLIEAVDKSDRRRAESEIVEGLRYRIRPLLTGAVVRHLEKRNIVH